MFDERTGVLAHWGFLSFRELDQHSAAAYLSGVLIRTLLFMSLIYCPFCFGCFLSFSVLHGDSGALPHSFFYSPLGGLHFRSLSSLYSYCGRFAALAQRLCFSRPFAFFITLIPQCFLLLSRSSYAHCPIYARVIRYAPYEVVLTRLGSVWVGNFSLFSTVIPLYIHVFKFLSLSLHLHV
jgi:hypothetical protein